MSRGMIASARSRRATDVLIPWVQVAGSNHSPTAPNPAAAATSTVCAGSTSSTVPAASDTSRVVMVLRSQ